MHCKDTILRTQNSWPYSKIIPNSGIPLFVSTLEKGIKNPIEIIDGDSLGWTTKIRTWTNRTKTCCAAITP